MPVTIRLPLSRARERGRGVRGVPRCKLSMDFDEPALIAQYLQVEVDSVSALFREPVEVTKKLTSSLILSLSLQPPNLKHERRHLQPVEDRVTVRIDEPEATERLVIWQWQVKV